MRKSTLTRKVREEKLTDVREGRTVLSLSTSLKERLTSVVQEGLPPGKFVLTRDLIRALGSATKLMKSMTTEECEVVCEFMKSRDLILTSTPILARLNAADAPQHPIEEVLDAKKDVQEMERRMSVTQIELRSINEMIQKPDANLEDFRRAWEELSYPDHARALVDAASLGVNLEFTGNRKKLRIKDCRLALSSLPSQHPHRFKCKVVSVADNYDGSCAARFVVENLIEPSQSVVKKYRQLGTTFSDAGLRKALALAFLDGLDVDLVTELTSVPLNFREGLVLDVDIVSCDHLAAFACAD